MASWVLTVILRSDSAVAGPSPGRRGEAAPVFGATLGDPPLWTTEIPNPGRELRSLGLGSASADLAVNTASREESRVFFNAVYLSSENQLSHWTGDIPTGNAGTNSPEFLESLLVRINYFRAMAGVPGNVILDDVLSRKAQQAALMMSAARQLSHFPTPDWPVYTQEGAEAAAHGNIALSFSGVSAVDGYMSDFGANNAAVGHRRWLLYPQTRRMGIGSVDSDDTFPAANAIWVHDPAPSPTRPTVRDLFVAWPPPGYVPYRLAFSRWSFSHPGANFSQAQVSMLSNGVPLGIRLEGEAAGYGENTLVWVPEGQNADRTLYPYPAPASDQTNIIRIEGVLVAGVARTFVYTNILFDPAVTGDDTVVPAITGPIDPPAGQASEYRFNAVPRADGYRWRQSRLSPFLQVEGAEEAQPGVLLDVSPGYSVVNSDAAASGGASFHLAHAEARPQRITLTAPLLLGEGAALHFAAFLGLASSGQIALAQVSTDGGLSWADVWSQVGQDGGTVPDVVFAEQVVPLTAFAGRIVQVRFVYDYVFGEGYFPQTDVGIGFHLDDIAVSNAERVQDAVEASTDGTRFPFTPSALGDYLLEVQPRYFGEYFAGYGPSLRVTSVVPVLPLVLVVRSPVTAGDGRLSIEFSVMSGPMPPASDFRLQWSPTLDGAFGEVAVAPPATLAPGSFRFPPTQAPGTTGFYRVGLR
ncbi:MAG: hypothetical protein RIS76_3128 [Verrucomicrobiota bacterium]